MTETTNLHIAVVGAGPGGYAAAFLAADLGLKVTLIDPEINPGGVCLYRGCIPSKALLHVAKLIDETLHAKNWGLDYADPNIDLPRLRSWKEGVVKKLTGGLGLLSKQRKVEYIQGRAAFENSNTLRVSRTNGGEDSLTFDRIVIATQAVEGEGSEAHTHATRPGAPADHGETTGPGVARGELARGGLARRK